MKKIKTLLTISLASLLIASCSNGEDTTTTTPVDPTEEKGYLINGGFESTDLSGWTVEYGDAFTDDSVSSQKTFSYANDNKHQEINVNATGNWHLNGKGFDGKQSHARIGAIRSNTFKLGGDGSISMKLAGGALTKGKGTDAAYKDLNQLCFVGIYRVSDDKLIHMQHNDYFIEHTEDYVDVSKYNNGVYNTDNFTEYTVDLSAYLGESLYIRIVDNDKHVYYGYLSVDDIRIGGELPQPEGQYFVKTRHYIEDVEAPSEFEIKNGGFETGSLAGYQVLEGQAFSNEGVNSESVWWNENITYDRDGNYHYGFYKPETVGRMRTSTFTLGGSGYISFKLGGCMHNDLTYLSVYAIKDSVATEVARYSNRKYWNFQFPYVANGMRLLNMVQYIADLTEYLGYDMFIEIVDNDPTPDDLTCMTIDSIQTHHLTKPTYITNNYFDAISMISIEIEPDNQYQVPNGTFEKGDLTGWTVDWDNPSNPIGVVSDASTWWAEQFPYNKRGTYLFTGCDNESGIGTMKSSTFVVGGINKMSFRIGGGKNPQFCYISICDAATGAELLRFSNRYFHDLGAQLINQGCNLMNMVQYVADLSSITGRTVYIKVTDNAANDWGLLTLDSFITYYETEGSLPESYYVANNILPEEETPSVYKVTNGGFETGDLTGWTKTGNIGGISASEIWWNEWYSFNKSGTYLFNGWNGNEADTGTLVSSSFTVGGINKISFKLGGAKNKSLCYVSIIDASTNEELVKFSNYKFQDTTHKYYYNGQPIDLASDGVYKANMVQYIADLTDLAGREVKIKIVDNASNDWGLVFVDDFVTYYANAGNLPTGFEATY